MRLHHFAEGSPVRSRFSISVPAQLRSQLPPQRAAPEDRARARCTRANSAEIPTAQSYTLQNAKTSQRGSAFWRRGPASAEFFTSRSPSKPGHAGLVEDLVRHHYFDARPAEALRRVDRQAFVPQGTPEEHVYLDVPLRYARGQTISAPHMHAYALQILYKSIHHGASVLDVGSGSGYLVAACAVLAGSTGTVLGVETAPKLVQISLHNLKRWQQARAGQPMASITIRCGNAWQSDVMEGFGPFDAIHVGAAADTVPEALIARLKPGGRMLIPLAGPEHSNADPQQFLTLVQKEQEGTLHLNALDPVAYVPLNRPYRGYQRQTTSWNL